MALIPLLVPAAITAAKTLYTAFNRPKLQEPTRMIETLDKQIANNSADIVGKTLLNTTTSAAKSAGSRLYQQQERGINQMAERGNLSEGQEAQALLGAGTGVQSVVGEQSQNMLIPQMERNMNLQQQNNQARLGIAQMKDEARMRLQQERQQWKNELAGGLLDTATAAFGGIMQNIENNEVKLAVTGYLTNRGVQDIGQLDDDGLQGLLTTLILAKSGISPLATPAASSAKDKTGEDTVIPDIPGVENLRADLDRMKKGVDKGKQVLAEMKSVVAGGTPATQAATQFDQAAFNRIANRPAYQTMLTKLNTDYAGNASDPAFKAWLESTYTTPGTYAKFLRAYNAGRGQ